MSLIIGNVLLVEDDAALSRSIRANLGARGWHVTVCARCDEMLAHLAQAHVDVVVLDVQLPDGDGLEALARVRALPGAPPVVIVSGYLDVNITLDALRMGAFDVLEKPVAPAHLVDVLLAAREAPTPEVGDDLEAATGLVGRSPAMQRLREQIAKVAAFHDLPVLVIGESGTGKELVARAVHQLGRNRDRLVEINCAAMPEPLFESELFGHASGAFTGARGPRIGLLEAAGNGSLFLDEIGETPFALQAKLLRVLETRTFRRVGANDDLPFRARVISATNRPLRGRQGEPLRSDLFFRLAGYTIATPPLRARIEDVPDLARHFLRGFAETHSSAPAEISREALKALETHDWPGNVRELRAVLQSAIVRTNGPVIGVRQIAQALHAGRTTPLGATVPSSRPPPRDARSSAVHTIVGSTAIDQGLPEVERSLILRVAQECNGNLSHAARRLKIPRSTLRDRLKRYGAL